MSTGTSSLGLLRDLSLDGLKIDRSFVQRLARDDRQQTVVGAIHAWAVELGLRVVAEGVEEAEDAEGLRDIGIRHAQGFLWAKPAPADELEELLGGYRRLVEVCLETSRRRVTCSSEL